MACVSAGQTFLDRTFRRGVPTAVAVLMAGALLAPSVFADHHRYDRYREHHRNHDEGDRDRMAGTAFVELGVEQQVGDDPYVIDAFVPTDSDNVRCLATLNESNYAASGTTVYCNHRAVDGVEGIRVIVLLPIIQDVTLPGDLFVDLTVYQPFAQRYGDPVPYSGE